MARWMSRILGRVRPARALRDRLLSVKGEEDRSHALIAFIPDPRLPSTHSASVTLPPYASRHSGERRTPRLFRKADRAKDQSFAQTVSRRPDGVRPRRRVNPRRLFSFKIVLKNNVGAIGCTNCKPVLPSGTALVLLKSSALSKLTRLFLMKSRR